MKRIFYSIISILLITSCKDDGGMDVFDAASSYVYFAYPTTNPKSVERYVDSMSYNFALDDTVDLTSKVLKIPIRVAGLAHNDARSFRYQILESSDYDAGNVSFSSAVIGANKIVDTLFIRVQNIPELRSRAFHIDLALLENENFKNGNAYNQKIRIKYSNELEMPIWWDNWEEEFGPYYREVYQQWMRIYRLGLDPTGKDDNSNPDFQGYYWGNMPSMAVPGWYPVTYQYIFVLNQYFKDHEIYPNGDRTQARILLP